MRLPNSQSTNNGGMQLRMTPMIDIVFLLLIFFLWTSSFDRPEYELRGGVAEKPESEVSAGQRQTPLPETETSELLDEIVIAIRGNAAASSLAIGEQPIADLNVLKDRLSALADNGLQPPVIIDPDDTIPGHRCMPAAIATSYTAMKRCP
ncbi:MAG: biopolymer transporter ExbD, partial [Planctomycetota bacterium]